MGTHRTFRHEPEYAKACDDLIAENERYRDVIAGLEWSIAQDPHAFPLASEEDTGVADMRVAPSDPIGGVDPLSLYYTIDGPHTGTFWWLRKVNLTEFLNGLF